MSSTSDAPIQTVENTLVADNSVEAPPQQTTPNIMCHVHPAIAAIDKCYKCRELICVACKDYVTIAMTGSVHIPFTVCVSCVARYPQWPETERRRRNDMGEKMMSTCFVQ